MSSGVWRSRNLMVLGPDATLPDRCVKTNLPADGSWVDIRLSWHHPVVYLVLLANLLIYLIVAHFVSKRVIVRLGISEQAVSSYRRAWMVTWGLLGLGFALTALGVLYEVVNYLAIPGVLLMVVAIPVYLWGTRIVRAARIDDGFVWIAGVHPDYLDTLPEWDLRK